MSTDSFSDISVLSGSGLREMAVYALKAMEVEFECCRQLESAALKKAEAPSW